METAKDSKFHEVHIMEMASRTSSINRLNAICPYFTMFPLDFPLAHLQRRRPTTMVLDPFCGRGTTLFASRLLGLNAVGLDSSPVAVAVSMAKGQTAAPGAVESLCRYIITTEEAVELPTGEFWDACYDYRTLLDICKLRSHLCRQCNSSEEIVLRALILGILHGPLMKRQPSYLSNQMPRTSSCKPDYSCKYWRVRNMSPPHVDVLELVARRARHVLHDVPPMTDIRVYHHDSREDFSELANNVGVVLTSPPYLGMTTYNQDQWLRNWFLGGPSRPDYSKDGQLSSFDVNKFVEGLSTVWKNAAEVCESDAELIVRIGSLPSTKHSPRPLLEESLARSGRWKLRSIEPAGIAKCAMRQSSHLVNKVGNNRQEIDCVAELI